MHTRRFVRCFWALDQERAQARFFPAIHPLHHTAKTSRRSRPGGRRRAIRDWSRTAPAGARAARASRRSSSASHASSARTRCRRRSSYAALRRAGQRGGAAAVVVLAVDATARRSGRPRILAVIIALRGARGETLSSAACRSSASRHCPSPASAAGRRGIRRGPHRRLAIWPRARGANSPQLEQEMRRCALRSSLEHSVASASTDRCCFSSAQVDVGLNSTRRGAGPHGRSRSAASRRSSRDDHRRRGSGVDVGPRRRATRASASANEPLRFGVGPGMLGRIFDSVGRPHRRRSAHRRRAAHARRRPRHQPGRPRAAARFHRDRRLDHRSDEQPRPRPEAAAVLRRRSAARSPGDADRPRRRACAARRRRLRRSSSSAWASRTTRRELSATLDGIERRARAHGDVPEPRG